MSHTPGPWDVDDDTMEIFSITPGHSTGWIAKVLGNDDNGRPLTPDEMAANARLIAAAPDLLAACKLALTAGDQQYVQFILRDVIAKAEGVTMEDEHDSQN
jgi:hypothetical protein